MLSRGLLADVIQGAADLLADSFVPRQLYDGPLDLASSSQVPLTRRSQRHLSEAAFPTAFTPAHPTTADEWENLEGLPGVTLSSPSDAYVSKDIADAPGISHFKPTLGCKCGDWRPAPAHPEIDFKPGFVASHSDFLDRVHKLQVHMEDVTAKKVHWDAVYDLRKFLAVGDRVRLVETTPAVVGRGSQLRFLQFCPPEGGQQHMYKLQVTALDARDKPIDYFQNKASTYFAQPPSTKPKTLPLGQQQMQSEVMNKKAAESMMKAEEEMDRSQTQLARAKASQDQTMTTDALAQGPAQQ